MKLITRALMLFGLLTTIQCGSSTAPTSNTTMTFVLSAATVPPGLTTQGTVSLNAPPSGSVSIALSSSNAAVATVPGTVTIPAGSSSATFTVTAVAPGTATITASLSGSRAQSAALTVTSRTAALAGISLSASTVVEGSAVTGTATLTAAAPPGGAVVALSSAGPVIMPTSLTVNAGETSATFSISTRLGGGGASATITGSYDGASASAVLSVTKPSVAIARFGVTGPTESETCEMSNGGRTLSCTFDGGTSGAPGNIVAFDWSYAVAGTYAQTTTGAVLRDPAVDCSLLPPPPLTPGNPWFTLTITLKIHDDRGNVAQAINTGARLLPNGTCGF